MSKRNIILIVLICLLAGIAAGVFFLRPSLEKIDINRGGPPGPSGSVPQVLTKSFPSEDNPRYTVQVDYPELQGVATPGVQEKVSGGIRTQIYNQIAAFQAANATNLPLEDPEMRSSFDGSFDVVLLTRSFFSGIMSYSDYSAGAAHPNSYNVALNYDLKTGEPVTLNKFLQGLNPSAGYMNRLGKYVKEDLVRQFGNSQDSLSFIDFSTTPNGDGYANFTLNTEGLSIHFDPGQVAPIAAGSSATKISYADLLASVIKPADTGAAATSSVKWWLQ